MQSDEQEIRDTVARWHAASKAGDVDTVLSLMTDDVVFLLPGRAPMDKHEFASLSQTTPNAPRPTMEMQQEIKEVKVAGDWAFIWTQLAVTVTPPGAKDAIERAGHTLTVFQRVQGKWLLARDANLLTVIHRAYS